VHSSSNLGVFTLHPECVRLWKGEERTGFSRVPTHSSLSNARAVKLGFLPYPPFSFDRPCGEGACLFLLARKCQLLALRKSNPTAEKLRGRYLTLTCVILTGCQTVIILASVMSTTVSHKTRRQAQRANLFMSTGHKPLILNNLCHKVQDTGFSPSGEWPCGAHVI
jgi:hypothetical protein